MSVESIVNTHAIDNAVSKLLVELESDLWRQMSDAAAKFAFLVRRNVVKIVENENEVKSESGEVLNITTREMNHDLSIITLKLPKGISHSLESGFTGEVRDQLKRYINSIGSTRNA